MSALPAASLAIAIALAVVTGCGGGGGGDPTTTSAPLPVEETTTSVEPTTTTTTIDPALQAFLLVAADLPGFKDQASPTPSAASTTCDPLELPGARAVIEAPAAIGATLVRGAGDVVRVSSRVSGTAADQSQAGLTELLDPKAASCLESDLRAAVEEEQPAGTTVTLELAASEATVAGAEQAVVLAGTATVTGDTVSRTLRMDVAFLRTGGTVLVVTYFGPSGVTSGAERQGIVVTAAAKLSGSTTSTTVANPGSPTSSTRRTSTTRRRATATTTSTSLRASTTSSAQPAGTTSSSTP